MIIKRKEALEPALKKELQEYVYKVVGVLQDVHGELPCGMPEYVYQEALDIAFRQEGIDARKEYVFHPSFRGKTLNAYMKMDFVIPANKGNIIIECKAVEEITSHEYHQLFSYMMGTQFPIGILVNFHAYPRVQIHKFYYDKSDQTITSF